MKQHLIFYGRLARVMLHLLLALAIILLIYPFLKAAQRQSVARWWAQRVFHLCQMTWVVRGALPAGARMFVMNHISWLDIYALNALRPSQFVAKAEIRSWPLIGLLSQRTGTIFIERGKRHAVHDVVRTLAQRLRDGHSAAVFPEGTTTCGDQLLPFHANLIEAALQAQVPITPIALRYTYQNERSEVPAYVDELSLMQSIKRVLMHPGLMVELTLLPDLFPEEFKTRHALAQASYAAISQALRLPVPGPETRTALARPDAALGRHTAPPQ